MGLDSPVIRPVMLHTVLRATARGGGAMQILDRIGIDIGIKQSVEDGLHWAAAHGLHYVDFRLDTHPEAFVAFTPERWRPFAPRRKPPVLPSVCIRSPPSTLRSMRPTWRRPPISICVPISISRRPCNAGWVDVHAGYHFTSDVAQRTLAGLERLKRAVGYAEAQGVLLLLENLNWEPAHAEVHYLAHNLAECQYYFDAIDSPHLRWAFTVNHAALVPEGIDGFLDQMGLARCEEVRLADSHGRYEEHLPPGEG